MNINTVENVQQLNVDHCIAALAMQLKARLSELGRDDCYFVGIQTGGLWVAERLGQHLNKADRLGSLNISFYRDDFSQIGLHPTVNPSSLRFSVDNAHIVLVDDVIMSGRTIRAALNELFDFGRPLSVTLATLVDLQANALPIRPDVSGISLTLAPNQRIKLNGPSPLSLVVKTL
ncbi:MAG: bifunctional pyr operon transcriptional regulator/uracil phosphoribosyltransferase PyrR [Gammaproteobacteria bacterium]